MNTTRIHHFCLSLCFVSIDTPWIVWRFIVGAFFCIFGLPFVLVTGISLYSKLLPTVMQGWSELTIHGFSIHARVGGWTPEKAGVGIGVLGPREGRGSV